MTDTASAVPWPTARYAWYALAIIALGYVFAFVDRIAVGMLTPAIIADLHISDTQAGLLQGIAFAVFYTLFGLPLGWLTDRGNRQRLLALGMTAWSVMTAACGLQTAFWPLFAARVGVGIGEATLNPCASSLIADYFPPAKRPRAFGVYTMATALAAVVSTVVLSGMLNWLNHRPPLEIPVFGSLHPWQAVFFILGVAGLVPAVLFAVTVREPARRGIAPAGQADGAATFAFLRANGRTFACLMIGAALVILEIYATAYWSPTFFLRAYGWPPEKSGLIVGTLQGIGGLLSAYSSGPLTTWFKNSGRSDGALLTVLVGAVGCTVFGGLGPLMPIPALGVVCFALKSLFVNYGPAGTLTAFAEVTPNQHRGFVVAVYVIMTGLFAQGLGPLGIGVITESVFHNPQAIGLSIALLVFTTGAVGILLLFAGRRAYRRSLAAATWNSGEPGAVPGH